MNAPDVPGQRSPSREATLLDLWQRPTGEWPDGLWPEKFLANVRPEPEGWLRVLSDGDSEGRLGRTKCVLLRPDDEGKALRNVLWPGRFLGRFSAVGDEKFDNSLAMSEHDCSVSFLVQLRVPDGTKKHVLDVHLPFLWYWDAYQTESGWSYITMNGQEQELVRWQVADYNTWHVDISALELRAYLARCKRSLLMRVQTIKEIEYLEIEGVVDSFENDWAHFTFNVTPRDYFSPPVVSSGITGRYVIRGSETSRVPRWLARIKTPRAPHYW